MATTPFDTHKFVRKLQDAGFEQKQAEALTEAMRAAIDESELVTRKDLQIELAPVRADLNLLKWMVGLLLGGVMLLLLRAFVPV
ncbi:MAG: coiled-coil domain-containing protein [Pseudomonadota bacterium]